ncbi:MAG: hypothetical protein AAF688_11525 [Bacteroidota bacterium]
MKYPLILLLTFSFFTVSGQSFDDIILKNKYVDCEDVFYNASSIIKDFYNNGQIDKVYEFLDYWESKCGNLEVIRRFRTILDLGNSRFSNVYISEETIEDLISYRSNLNQQGEGNQSSLFVGNDFYQSLSSLDKLTQQMASGYSSGTQDGRLLLGFYADNSPTFEDVKSASNSSELKVMHNLVYEKTLRIWEWQYAFYAGFADHYQNLSVFGLRPSFGFSAGAKQLRHNIDLVFDIRIGPSDGDYDFVYQGELITDDTFTGFYIGGEYTYDFIHSEKLNIGISPGIAYENITSRDSDEDTDEDGKYLPSFNKNIGLVFKYRYGRRGGYAGLHLRYNWVDYENDGGTRLNGEYFSLRLVFGNIFSHVRDTKLRNLE